MEFKGTKGKWEVEEYFDEKYDQPALSISAESADCFISIWTGKNKGEDIPSEDKANALLISNAPKMLEKLIEVRKWYEENQYRLGEYTPVIFGEILSLTIEVTQLLEATELK